MADESGIRVYGLQTLIRSMRKAGVDISELKDAHHRAASIVADAARELAPRRSGALAGTIRPARQANKARISVGSAKVPYAGPIHWGWGRRNIAPSLFLTRAAVQTEAEWTTAYFEDVQKALDNVKGA